MVEITLSKRTRIALLILINVFCIVFLIWIFLGFQNAQGPELQVTNFSWSDEFDHVFVAGTIVNSGDRTVDGIILAIGIYTWRNPSWHGQTTLLRISNISIGSMLGKSSRDFDYNVSYSPSDPAHIVNYTLTWSHK